MTQQEVRSWFVSMLSFEARALVALTGEERLLVEEEKARFFKEIGVGEDMLQSWFQSFLAFTLRIASASTDEERQSVEKEMDSFFKSVEDYKKDLDEYNLESQNSIPTAA